VCVLDEDKLVLLHDVTRFDRQLGMQLHDFSSHVAIARPLYLHINQIRTHALMTISMSGFWIAQNARPGEGRYSTRLMLGG